MSEVYIRSQNKEKLYRLGGNYACVEYGEYEDIKKKRGGAEADKKRHVICISDGCLEEIGEYATKERCLEVLDEIQKACVRVRKRVQAVAADTTTLTEKMRAALRISSTSEKITEEINDCIAACKADMKNDGVKVIKETDGLIIRAITLYCKAEFGFNNAAEQFRKSYDALKMRLSLSAEYNTAPQVSETDTNSTESGV